MAEGDRKGVGIVADPGDNRRGRREGRIDGDRGRKEGERRMRRERLLSAIHQMNEVRAQICY